MVHSIHHGCLAIREGFLCKMGPSDFRCHGMFVFDLGSDKAFSSGSWRLRHGTAVGNVQRRRGLERHGSCQPEGDAAWFSIPHIWLALVSWNASEALQDVRPPSLADVGCCAWKPYSPKRHQCHGSRQHWKHRRQLRLRRPLLLKDLVEARLLLPSDVRAAEITS